MADSGKNLIMFGVIGAGGYLIYEYMQYSSAMNTASSGNATNLSALEQALPFLTWLQMNWTGAASGTTTQQTIYNGLQSILSGTAAASTTSTTPGTTPASTGTPTTVSTAPPSTTTTSGSTAPSTTPQPIVQTAPTIVRQPVSTRSGILSMATQMQSAIGMSTANADQWNYAFRQITGQDISTYYGFNFDTVYGAVVNGARSSGQLTAQAFLNMGQGAATVTPTQSAGSSSGGTVHPVRGGVKGLGAIARYPGPAILPIGNLLYQAHHPLPYLPSYTLKGLGGFGRPGLGAPTHPLGFERALYAGLPLRSNKVL